MNLAWLKVFGATFEIALGPIGLVILALAALGVGLYLLWTKSTTFRVIVESAFNAVKGTALAVINWFLRSFVPFFTVTIPHAFSVVLNWVRSNWGLILVYLTNPVAAAAPQITRYANEIIKSLAALARRRSHRLVWAFLQRVALDPLRRSHGVPYAVCGGFAADPRLMADLLWRCLAIYGYLLKARRD